MSAESTTPYMPSQVGQRIIEHAGLKFGKLTVYDRMEISKAMRTSRRERLIANLRAVGATKEEFLGELERFDDTPDQAGDFYVALFSASGQVDILLRALSKIPENTNPEQILKEAVINADDVLPLCADLCGVKLRMPGADEGEQSGTPPPQSNNIFQHNDDLSADAPSYGSYGIGAVEPNLANPTNGHTASSTVAG